MNDPSPIEIYGLLENISVRTSQHPRETVVEFDCSGLHWILRFSYPKPLAVIMQIFDGCWGFRVIDLNVASQKWLEFGRFQVELLDEDGAMASFLADEVAINP